jgi:hypothetical protein
MGIETEISLKRGRRELWPFSVQVDSHTYVDAHAAPSVWLFLELCDSFCIIKNVPCNCSVKVTFGGESYYLHTLFLLKMCLTRFSALLEDTDNQHRV